MLRNEKKKTKFTGQFYQVDARIFDLALKPIPFAVYSYLVFCAGHKRNCFPSVRTIANSCSCSESAVRSAINELIALGLVSKEYCYRENRYGVRQQTSNTYGILPIPRYYENGAPRYDYDDELPF